MKHDIRKDNLVGVRQCVSNVAKLSSYAPVPEIVRRDLARQMAEFLSHQKVETIEREYITEYRMEFYVFTQDEFYKAVQEEAREMVRWFETSRMPPPVTKGGES